MCALPSAFCRGWSAILTVFLAMAACAVDLGVPESAVIACASDADCPADWRCDLDSGACIERGELARIAPTVAVGRLDLASRPLSEIVVELALADANGTASAPDPLTLLVEVNTAADPSAGTWFAARSVTVAGADERGHFPATSATRVTTLTWDILGDAHLSPALSVVEAEILVASGSTEARQVLAFHPSVTLRITATDRAGSSAAPLLTETFAVGNEAPVATLVGVDTADVLAGSIPVAFSVADTAADPSDIEIQFRVDPAAPWRTARVAFGATTGVPTLPDDALVQVVVWDSRYPPELDVTVPQGIGNALEESVELRMRATDYIGNDQQQVGPWTEPLALPPIVNQTPPRIEQVEARRPDRAAGVSPVAITYRLVDAESDWADVDVEYSFDLGKSWNRCRELLVPPSEGRYDLATSPADPRGGGGIGHIFVWDAAGIAVAIPATTRLRLSTSDSHNAVVSTIEVQLPRTIGPASTTSNESPWTALELVGEPAEYLLVEHLNRDMIPDWVGFFSGELRVYLGEGEDGIWAGTYSLAYSNSSFVAAPLSLADLDNDSIWDLIISTAPEVTVLIGESVAGIATGGFVPASSVALSGTGRVAARDLNGDGVPDLVRRGSGSPAYSPDSCYGLFVALAGEDAGVWDGTFAPRGEPYCAGPVMVGSNDEFVLADLTGDGVVDAVVAGNSASPHFIRGVGDGTFEEAQYVQAGVWNVERYDLIGWPARLAALDLNGDGYADLIGSEDSGDLVAVRLNKGGAASPGDRFGPVAVYRVGDNPQAVDGADLNGDGVLDLCVYNRDTSDLSVLIGQAGDGDGDGTFQPELRLEVDANPMAIGDLNTDGIPDFLYSGTTVGALLSSGTHNITLDSLSGIERYETSATHMTGGEARDVKMADLDLDGALDLVVASRSTGGLDLFYGGERFGVPTGELEGGPHPEVIGPALALELVDLDGDHVEDVIISPNYAGQVGVSLSLAADGVPTGRFAPMTFYGAGMSQDVRAMDVNGDGLIDIIALTGTEVRTFLATAAASFDGASVVNTGVTLRQLTMADFDGDAWPDLAVVTDSPQVGLLFNDGAGQFGGWTTVATVHRPEGVAAEDFNQDGIADLAVGVGTGGGAGELRVLLGNGSAGRGNGTFALAQTLTIDDTPRSLFPADLNGDGVFDLVVGCAGEPSLTLLAGQRAGGLASGQFEVGATITTERGPWAVSVADLNGDWVVDVAAVLNIEATLVVALGQGQAAIRPTTADLIPFADELADGDYILGSDVARADVDRLGKEAEPPQLTRVLLPDLTLTMRAEAPQLPHDLVPLTHAYALFADRRLARVPVAGAPGSAGDRVRVEARLGPRASPDSETDYRRLGLDLAPTAGTSQRGVIARLPFLDGRTNAEVDAAAVRVLCAADDLLRADQVASDPLSGEAGAGEYLPIRDDGGTVIAPHVVWREIPSDEDADFATGAGERYIVSRLPAGKRRVYLLSDTLGRCQAFLSSSP